jgi:hypothetical protein
MKREDFALFWSVPPDDIDWDNLRAGGAMRMQVMLAFANHETLAGLADLGVKCTVRLDEADYADDETRRRAAGRLAGLAPAGLVDTVIIGVEPENVFNFRFGSPTWGQVTAMDHARRLQLMLDLVRPMGLRTVSAGWTARGIDMNWSDAEGVQPGLYAWLELTRMAYNACDLNGFHLYGYDGTDYDLWDRMRRHLWVEQARRHKPIYIDELGVAGSSTATEKMRSYLRLATALLGPMGERVEALTPFVSNGTGVGWDPRFLLRDREPYLLLKRFMDGESF